MSGKLKLAGKLTITIGEGKDLTDVLTLGTMDPFCKVECGGEKYATKVHKSGGKKPVWNQSFMFNPDGKKELDRVHFSVYSKGLLSDTAVGRCDIPIETLLKCKEPAMFQLVSVNDFHKIAGNISLSCEFTGTGAPQAPLPSFKDFQATAAAATATAAAPAPVATATPAIVAAAPAPVVMYGGAAPVAYAAAPQFAPQYSAAPQVMYQPQPQVMYQPMGGAGVMYAQPQPQQVMYQPQPQPQPKVIMAAPSNKCSAGNKQAGWRWCSRCQVLWYGQYNNSLGVCAAGGGHNYQGSGHYHAPLQSGNGCNGQAGWKWCCRCMAMFYGAAVSVCPAGGPHDASGSGDYTMCLGNQHGQYGWGWCSRCGVFWYTANKASSYCPAGGNHNNQGSGNYQLGHD